MAIEILVNIDVDALPRAEHFYCEAFGLRPGRRFGDSGIELLGGSSAIYLLEKAAGTRATPTTARTRDYSRHWTPVHLDFVVPDVDAAVEKALAAGGKLEGRVRTANWGRLATLADPFGNGVCLIEFIGRGYDEIAT